MTAMYAISPERMAELRRLSKLLGSPPAAGNPGTYLPWTLAAAVPELLDALERLHDYVENVDDIRGRSRHG